ncbi:hypothetical protein PENTCL1PPCAC_15595, partial [Pristionchus entomophagus]
RVFGAYTLYISEDTVENFFDDFTDERGNVEEAKKNDGEGMRNATPEGTCYPRKNEPQRARIPRTHHSSLLGYDFVTARSLHSLNCIVIYHDIFKYKHSDGLGARDEIMTISERYQHQISNELHHYYRDVLHLDDYASRWGELQMLLPMFECHEGVKETFEVLRLLDIFTDDSFTYQLNK